MTGEIDPAPEPEIPEPIDADFEPIADVDTPAKAGGGPGWLGVGVASMIAAGVGGLIGITMDKPAGGGAAEVPASVISDLQVLKDAQTQTDKQLNRVTRDAGELETRMKAEMSDVMASGEGAETLAPLIAELEDVSKRLDEAMANAGDPEAFTELTGRLDALEAVDTSGEASPKDLQRAVAALTERVERLDAAAEQLDRQIEDRDETLEQLGERLTEAEFALEDARGSESGAAQASVKALETELAALREQISESSEASGADSARVAALMAELEARDSETQEQLARATSGADAALALSGIEAASRRGEGFQADFAKLSAALPKSRAVRTLKPLAVDGAPTLAELQAEFDTARVAALKADTSDNDLGLLNRIFGDSVQVRSKSGSGDAAATETLKRANGELTAGKLDQALTTLEALDGAPASAMADWTRRAKRRKTLEDGLETLRLDLIRVER